SPIVRRILFLSNPTENDNYDAKTVSHYIKRLDKIKPSDMDEYIIDFLADDRFNWQPDQENLRGKVENFRNNLIKFSKWHNYIEAYIKVAEPVLLRNENIEPEINFDESEVINALDEFMYEGNEV
ncbi:12756_t:CDS:1, partial [Racocetra persica]